MKRLLKGSLAIASAAVIFAGNMSFTAVNVLADSNETEVIPSIDNTVYTGTWGTCNWIYDNGILTISGGVAEGSKSWDSYKNNIEKIVITGKITFDKETSLYGLFSKMTSLKTIEGLSNLDTSKVTDMDSMFRDCSSLETLDVSGFDTSRVTNMSGMFYGCNALTTLDVSQFDTSKVTYMGSMFHGCSSLETLDVSGFNTSNVERMDGMFYECQKLQNIDVSKFDTGKVKSMDFMFSGCKSITYLDVSNFDTSKVTDMRAMFQGIQCEELDLKNFDTSKVTDMEWMFGKDTKLKKVDVSSFDTSNVTDMSNMFYLCYKLYNLDISGFDMSKVTKMTEMFNGASLVTIKVPSKLSEDRDTFLKEMKSGMRSGKWIDETANINYDNKASVELSEGHSYKFNPGKMYVMLNMTNTTEGKELAASVKGGAYDYTYKFIMYNPSADKWTLLSDYSSSRSYILNMKGNGERKIYVDVKDALGNVVRTSKTITLTGQEPLTVEASKNETDKQVTFTAAAAGGSSDYTYKFIVYNKTTGTWGIVQNYSDKNTCTWTKGSAGDRDFYVDVKDSDGNVVRSKAMNVKIESNKPTAVLTPSATVLSTGDKLTLTASTDKTGCTYKFLIYNPATNQWFKLQDFSSKNTCKWTAGSNGTRQFYVDVKDASGNVTRSKVVNVTIGGEGALSVKTTVSANTTKVGDKITFTAEGAGGKAGYTYKMVVYNKTTKTWGLVQNFNANNKITWTAGSAGDREFYIDVKDADGKVVRSSVMNVKTSN
ncbi:MAG: BspA family leucine-rich repeat surface protein [Lachnospira eligens]